jgi:dipeptidase E
MRLLLLSNSTNHGAGYLDHAQDAVRELFGTARRIAFVPFALKDRAAYAARAKARFAALGLDLEGVTPDDAGREALLAAEGVFVGGGNTFRLLRTLQWSGLVETLRARARSAGTNLACPTIRTTNDMPIVEPDGFEALGLVPFQINPHYLDADPDSRHMGETREERLREFLEENERPVVGLREGAWLSIDDGSCRLEGGTARLFRRDSAPEELTRGASLDALLESS